MGFLRQRFPRLHYVRFKTEEERAAMNREIAAELGIDPIAYSH
jgi:transketolase